MKHTATLLLKDIANVYTMRNDLVLSDAFIAVYHQKIIEIGKGSYEQYLDSDTRILNGEGCIAIPGLIDSQFSLKPLCNPYLFEQDIPFEKYYAKHPTELLRDMQSLLYQTLNKGMTTFAYPSLPFMYEEALQRLHQHPYEFMCCDRALKHGVATCGYDPMTYPCFDPLYQMQQLFWKGTHCEIEILQGFSSAAADFLQLNHIGRLEVGKQADILLVEGRSIEYVLRQIPSAHLRSIIKKGTQQFPHIII